MMERPSSTNASAPAPVAFRLDIQADRRQQPDRVKFIVYALWLTGHSVGGIARALGLRRTQVMGLVRKSDWPNRSMLSDQKRQAELNLLREIRIDDDSGVALDGGKLRNFDWRVRPLVGRQVRTSRRAI